jgi:hypothetical protein
MHQPSKANGFLVEQVTLIRNSYSHLLRQELLQADQTQEQLARELFYAPFAVVSHNTDADPVFNYGNLAALKLFEFSWEEFTQLPSRLSAEQVNQAERGKLLAEVTQNGFIDHYEGLRISKSGKRFLIQNAVVWNLTDPNGNYKGQAALFEHWLFL